MSKHSRTDSTRSHSAKARTLEMRKARDHKRILRGLAV